MPANDQSRSTEASEEGNPQECRGSPRRKCADDDIVSLIGTRFDESVQRERKMSERGESAFEVLNLAAEAGGHDWVLSPIAEMTTMDVFS